MRTGHVRRVHAHGRAWIRGFTVEVAAVASFIWLRITGEIGVGTPIGLHEQFVEGARKRFLMAGCFNSETGRVAMRDFPAGASGIDSDEHHLCPEQGCESGPASSRRSSSSATFSTWGRSAVCGRTFPKHLQTPVCYGGKDVRFEPAYLLVCDLAEQ